MRNWEVNKAVNAADVADKAADYLLHRLIDLQQRQEKVHLALTGGNVGILTLKHIAASPILHQVDMEKLNVWFGDERFVERSSPDRNFNQAYEALLGQLQLPVANIHQFPAAENDLSLEAAAESFAGHLGEVFGDAEPAMDLMILGMGPDGHVASLFPGHDSQAELIVAEANSPKPPSQRLSFSMKLINRSLEIVFVVSGIDKSEAVEDVHKNPDSNLPAARVNAKTKTLWVIDEAAGAAFWSC